MIFVKKVVAIFFAAIFFCTSALAAEIIIKDAESGHWGYETEGLKIELYRRTLEKEKLIWYEIELWCSEKEPLMTMVTNENKPGASLKNPVNIARTNKYVLAVNDDFFGDRTYNRETVGVVIRNGVLVSKKTNKKSSNALPNLDTMAFYPDGSLEVNECGELTAEEFLEKGALNVLAFGPILIRDGEINPRLEKNFRAREPRTALGMVEPYHYVMIVLEGRHDKSNGSSCQFVAEKLKEMGAVQAINLDGGQTSALVFMGDKLNKTGKFGAGANIRNLSGMLVAGVSDEVPDYK